LAVNTGSKGFEPWILSLKEGSSLRPTHNDGLAYFALDDCSFVILLSAAKYPITYSAEPDHQTDPPSPEVIEHDISLSHQFKEDKQLLLIAEYGSKPHNISIHEDFSSSEVE
jgi:hypothetical protein